MRRFLYLIVLVCVAGPAIARAQCTSCAEGARVNASYQKDPYGHYSFHTNSDGSAVGSGNSVTGLWNFTTQVSGIRYRIGLPDPTILYLDGWYYVTGTSDSMCTANFAIYKSQDLAVWVPHMAAFAETGRTGWLASDLTGPFFASGGCDYTAAARTEIVINSRTFRRLASPQLYVNPANPETVWLAFGAAEGPWTRTCVDGTTASVPGLGTGYVASISKTAFENASGRFASPTDQPLRFTYRGSGGGPVQPPDGGVSIDRPTPCSANYALSANTCAGEANGQLVLAGQRWRFQTPASGTQGKPLSGTNIVGDVFMYFDSFASNEQWLMFTWRAERVPDIGYNGNNVAAHPMETDSLLKVSAPLSDYIPIAFRYSTIFADWISFVRGSETFSSWPKPSGNWMYNGFCDENAEMYGMGDVPPPSTARVDNPAAPLGVAEGPGAFDYGGRTYVYYTRNRWNSGAYGMWYRIVDRSVTGSRFTAASLASWNTADQGEHRLVRSTTPALAHGPSFGHGEIFWGPANRDNIRQPYVIFHGKDASSTFRTPYFKELWFDEDGLITPITNNGAKDRTDTHVFLLPWTGPACQGQLSDWDGSGVKTTEDLFAFLNDWAAGVSRADLNGDGLSVQDVFDFLNDWLRPCW